jgi:eukaryotic-like serine/threonine-protein kinase
MTQGRVSQSHLVEVTQIAAQFEAHWKSGIRPRLTEFLSRASTPARHYLLPELIGIDLDYRQRAGESPSIDDYQSTFSELSPLERERLTTLSLALNSATTSTREEGVAQVTHDVLRSPLPSNRFKRIEEIGRGGMGLVWRAVQMSTGREVALKELPAKALGSNIARSRFEEEIRWASQLQHPNIARVYDSGLLEGSYFYAMELIHGDNLDKYVLKKRLTLRQMLEIMGTIAGAMQYAHERKVIHRDLKPSNIMVTPEGKPIIVDFGLARMVPEGASDGTLRLGNVEGTPAYMAPEQAQGRDDLISPATDVYGLGVIIYYFIAGIFPHATDQAVDMNRRRTAEDKVRPVREINHRIRLDLDALIMKCLASNPSDRYADAGQLGSDIDRLLEGLELQAHPLSWIGKAKSWCCRPTRLLQAGNLSIAIGAIMASFHFIGICLGIAQSLGVLIPGFEGLRLHEFIALMASFLIYDAWLVLGGFMMRRNRVWAIWFNIATVICLLCWFILVLSGIVKFDTGGAVSSMAVRLPMYAVFSGFAAVGLSILCLAINAHYARAFLDEPLQAPRSP